MVFNVTIDFSFIEESLSILSNQNDAKILPITKHNAAKGIYNHALRFQNTEKDLNGFWRDKIQLESNKGEEQRKNILSSIDYIKNYIADFKESFVELEEYFPSNINLSTTLFCIFGYDIGVVSNGNAFLNVGHPIFHDNKRELLYFAMHELHHVAYTNYNPIYSLNELKNTTDLTRIIRYSTHLEGLAVYSSLKRRKRENGYSHSDYITLNDPNITSQLVSKFFKILDKYEKELDRELVDEDWRVLELMSDIDRLWYIVGAWMAYTIDRNLGRHKLNSTIIEGPNVFFDIYKKLMSQQ
jgi:hypothetical protein